MLRLICSHFLVAICGVFIGEGVCETVKKLVPSERPDIDTCSSYTKVSSELGSGMPSSHSALAGLLHVATLFISLNLLAQRRYRLFFPTMSHSFALGTFIVGNIVSIALNIAIAWSRVQLGCHTLEQVLFGFGGGIVEGLVIFNLLNLLLRFSPLCLTDVLYFISHFVPRFISGNYLVCFGSFISIGVSAGFVAHDPSSYINYVLQFPIVFLVYLFIQLTLIVVFDTLKNGKESYLPLIFPVLLVIFIATYMFGASPFKSCVALVSWCLVCVFLSFRFFEPIHKFIFYGIWPFSKSKNPYKSGQKNKNLSDMSDKGEMNGSTSRGKGRKAGGKKKKKND